jgi:amidase
MSDDLLFRPIAELAGLIRAGELSSRELVTESLARIDSLDPQLGAFVQVDHHGALATADIIERGDPRPFAGVPIAIKNNRAAAGLRLTNGCKLMRDFVASYDHGVVHRLRAAGFVIVGTTKLPEYGILPVTEPKLDGPARNPWDPERTPGGSSGGSAAAVAAGMVPLAHGNDGGGSLRIPAACCGLVGLKAQRHRISTAPDMGASPLVIDGVLTRTVAETAQLLDVLAGYVIGDTEWIPGPPVPFAAAPARRPRNLRIAFTTTPPIPGAPVDPVCASAVDRAAALAAELGHRVEPFDPPWQDAETVAQFLDYFAAQVALGIRFSALNVGRADPAEEDLEPMSWAMWRHARTIDAVAFQLLQTRLQARMRVLLEALEPYDALITPALAERPLRLGSLDTAAGPNPIETYHRSGYFTPFTAIFNVSGQPAISLPLFDGPDGLPLAVQIAGRPAGEAHLLALAAALEEAAPARRSRPPIS